MCVPGPVDSTRKRKRVLGDPPAGPKTPPNAIDQPSTTCRPAQSSPAVATSSIPGQLRCRSLAEHHTWLLLVVKVLATSRPHSRNALRLIEKLLTSQMLSALSVKHVSKQAANYADILCLAALSLLTCKTSLQPSGFGGAGSCEHTINHLPTSSPARAAHLT